LVGNSVINLNKGSDEEFSLIKEKINERIRGAYKGYKDFNNAWQEIQNIKLNQVNTLREFCQDYASAVLGIHNKYFSEAPEQVYEGNARELVESQCRKKWTSYISKGGYTLSSIYTTKVIEGHAFDCYAELLHNGKAVARAFGEAKNYGLLTKHLEIFEEWLEDVKFKPFIPDDSPRDIAFMIAPSCSPLLQRKLELKNIEFIQVNKVVKIEPGENNDKQDFNKLNVSKLKELARDASIKGFSKMKKAELIKALKQQQLIPSLF
jgi:hypothetical protein